MPAEKTTSFTKNLEDMRKVLDGLDENNVKYDSNDGQNVAKVKISREGEIIL